MNFFSQNSPKKYPLQTCKRTKPMKKPEFFYFTPIKIHEQDFPEEIQDADNQSTSGQGARSSSMLQNEEKFIGMNNFRHLAGLKFDKSSFVKLKNQNYTKNYIVPLNHIGKGAFGTVRKVQSIISKQYRAAKQIKKNKMKSLELQRLLKQVYIMMELDHPNIANVLEVYDYKNQFTLICELCEGGDLMKFIRSSEKKKNNQKIVANIIKQLLRAVIYLHNNGIVHRDIKPQNILFETIHSHNIKLIDFGIATKIQSNQKLTERVGTPAYMAPQTIYEEYNEKADVWAVGITMYHLIAGRIPFKGKMVQDIISAITKQQVQFYGEVWKNVSPGCIEVIKLMTKKAYRHRPSAKQIFEHPYFQKVNDFDLSQKQKLDFTDMVRKFQFKNKLQTAIQTFIASQLLSVEQKSELVDFFREFDKDNDGVISTQELKSVLGKRKKISEQRIESLMNIIDTNGSGKIDYTQFLAAGFLDAKSFTMERLRQAFAHFDTNGNGKISIDEVMEFMELLDDEGEELQKFFDEFDSNKDGSITEDQFITIMMERTKNINLEKLKGPQLDWTQKRQDRSVLDKHCLEFFGQGGFAQNFLKGSLRRQNPIKKSVQKKPLKIKKHLST